MARTKKRKAATVAGVSVLTAALLLGGTFAWQSISQMALNENKASVNPGARLHDDYSGNYAKSTAKAVSDVGVKRVYVENFTDEQDKVSVIARVRLDEYMEIGGSAGYKTVTTTEKGNIVGTYSNGVVTVSETDETGGQVKITLTALPYTGYKVDSVTADTSNVFTLESSGVYTYTYTPVTGGSGTTTPVNIAVSFVKDTHNDYTGDTIDPAVSLEINAKIDDVKTWETYIPETDDDGNLKENTASSFRDYVTLNFGWDSKYDTAGIYYMPTFNKNKDSLSADINGTYAKGFTDYVTYTANQKITDDAVYDADSNNIDDANVTLNEETHEAKAIDKTKSKVISMQKWLENPTTGDFWIYDTDGWAYWANLIAPEDATGLFLSRNEMTGKPEDNWYYGMNVVGQFVTPGDVGKGESTGFYDTDAGTVPSENAEILLAMLGGSKDKITGADVNQNGSLEIISGQSTTVSVANTSPLSMTSLNTIPDGWSSTDEKVAKAEALETNAETATITAKQPGEAYVIYKSESKLAAIKVKVDYETYTITEKAVSNQTSDPLLSKAIKLEEDAAGTPNAKLTIKGYFDADDVYYQVWVGMRAFCENKTLTTLIIEDGVSVIDYKAFFRCSSLKGTLKIPASVKKVSGDAFMETGLEELILEEGLEFIGDNAFRSAKLTTVNIPASVKTIFGSAFIHTLITNITVDPNNETFYYDTTNKVLFTTDQTLIRRLEVGVEEYAVPEGIVTIGVSAIRANPTLKTLTIPKSVQSFEQYAFYGNENLATIYYEGTESEWNAIEKGTGWNSGGMGSSVDGGTKIIYESTGPQE